MKRITEPISMVFSWAARYGQGGNYGSQMIVPLLQWNDCWDIQQFHNFLLVKLQQVAQAQPLNKFAVGNYLAEITVKNMTNIEATFDIYTCVVREDMDKLMAPQAGWGNAALGSGPQYANLLQAMTDGYTEQTGTAALSLSTWPVGVTPFDVTKFVTYMKIIKVKRDIVLNGGGFKRFKVADKKWRLWNGTKVYGCQFATNAQDVVFGKRTKFIFLMMRAGAVGDTGNANNATLAPCNIAVTGSERFMFTGIPNASKNLLVINGYNTIGGVSTIDMQTEVKDGYVLA